MAAIESLPFDICEKIFQSLTPMELVRIARVSKTMKRNVESYNVKGDDYTWINRTIPMHSNPWPNLRFAFVVPLRGAKMVGLTDMHIIDYYENSIVGKRNRRGLVFANHGHFATIECLALRNCTTNDLSLLSGCKNIVIQGVLRVTNVNLINELHRRGNIRASFEQSVLPIKNPNIHFTEGAKIVSDPHCYPMMMVKYAMLRGMYITNLTAYPMLETLQVTECVIGTFPACPPVPTAFPRVHKLEIAKSTIMDLSKYIGVTTLMAKECDFSIQLNLPILKDLRLDECANFTSVLGVPSLTKFHLRTHHKGVRRETLAICNLHQLVDLTVDGSSHIPTNGIDFAVTQEIYNLQALTTLSIGFGAHVTRLQDLPMMTEMKVHSGLHVTTIENFDSLETLEVQSCLVSCIRNLPNLRTLISQEAYSSQMKLVNGVTVIENLPRLRTLRLTGSFVKELHFDQELESLEVNTPTLRIVTTKTRIINARIIGAQLADLSAFANSETLKFEKCAAIVDLSPLGAQRDVEFDACNGIADVMPLRGIQSVAIRACKGIRDFTCLGTSKTLKIVSCPGLVDVSHFGNVHTLDISQAANVVDFSALVNVRHLIVRRCNGLLNNPAMLELMRKVTRLTPTLNTMMRGIKRKRGDDEDM